MAQVQPLLELCINLHALRFSENLDALLTKAIRKHAYSWMHTRR
jgi:hypothetical protein